jgi:steroid delta-isomerase-like uncharacterized protein
MFRTLRAVVVALVALTLVASYAPLAVRAQGATPMAGCPTTTPAENTTLVSRYWAEVFTRGGEAAVPAFVAPNEIHRWGLGADTTGIDAFTQQLDLILTAFPDISYRVDLSAAEGDRVATRWTASGTQTGEWQGIAPTGRRVSWSGINIFRIACGKIAESWSEADHIGLRQQLGATDVPEMMATPTGATATAARATPCPDDTPEQNVAIAHRWSEDVLTGKNLDVLDGILAPQEVHHYAMFPDAHGAAEVKAGLASLLAAFPDLVQTDEDTFADGDLVVVRWSARATHQGPLFGLPATGKPVMITGINIYRIDCGKIIESWSEANGLDLLHQIAGQPGIATPAA